MKPECAEGLLCARPARGLAINLKKKTTGSCNTSTNGLDEFTTVRTDIVGRNPSRGPEPQFSCSQEGRNLGIPSRHIRHCCKPSPLCKSFLSGTQITCSTSDQSHTFVRFP